MESKSGKSSNRGNKRGSSTRGTFSDRGKGQQRAISQSGHQSGSTKCVQSSKQSEPSSYSDYSTQQMITHFKNIKVQQSDVEYKIDPKKLSTVEIPDYKSYRLRSHDKLTIGKDLPVLTNVYNFQFSNDIYVDLYSVHFLNSEKKLDENFKHSKKRDVVMKVLKKEIDNSDLNKFIFDDYNLLYVLSGVLKNKKYEYCVDPDAKKIIYVRFEKAKHFPILLANTNNTSYTESINFLNLMLTQFARIPFSEMYNKKCTGIGNELYFRPPEAESNKYSLDFLRQIWPSLCFNILLGPRGLPLVNINQYHGVFLKSDLTIIDFYCQIHGIDKGKINLQNFSMDNQQRLNLTNHLKGINLTVIYNKSRDFTLFKVTDKIAEKTFIEKDEKKISIFEYFKQQYNITLKYSNMPLIQMNPEKANIYIPMELVKISEKPQKLKQKLEAQLTSILIKKCNKTPYIKFSEINNYLEIVKDDSDDILKIFGSKIGNQIKTEGKILPNIKVKYPVDDIRKREFYDKNLKNFSYGIVIVDRAIQRDKRDFYLNRVKHIIENITYYGCDFSKNLNPLYVIDFYSDKDLFKILKSQLESDFEKKKNNHLIIFLIKENCTSYGLIKMYCEQEEFLGCHSQVLKIKTLEKIKLFTKTCRVTSNIAMKINGKLGGLSKDLFYQESNTKLNEFKRKFFNKDDATIYIGADVIHPSPQDVGKDPLPSISAVVGSVDILGFKYAISGRIHTTTIKKGKQSMETLQFFQQQIKERLFCFKECTGVIPKHIVIFRDGISKSQFKITMEHEVFSIHKACEEINIKYKPTITFLIIQKRHGVRFLDTENHPNYNVPQNTVITKDIVNPELLDFYVVPHKGALGTSKPCHVYLLYDDWKLDLNEISLLTCWMANVCTRCPDPIGIPTPCYYADLACTRLKYHYIERKEFLKKKKNNNKVTIDIHPSMKNEQFFV